MASEQERPQRRGTRVDATRNREAILQFAYPVLTSGDAWSLNSIAKGAGVANATLYRHFPNRESLILATYQMEVDRVVDSAELLLERLPAGEALEAWVGELARYAMTKHGFADALSAATAPGGELFAETYDRIVGSLARLLVAAAEANEVRNGLDPDDVILALAGLWQLDPSSDWESRAHRLYRLVVAGLKP